MTELPDVKLRALPRFPVAVTGRTAINVVKINGHYYIDLDVSGLVKNSNISADQVAQSWMTIWNETLNAYQNVPYALAATSGVASLDGKTGALDIGDGLKFTGDTLEFDLADQIASQAQAEAFSGTSVNTVLMTPLRATQQAIVRDSRVDARDYGAIGDDDQTKGPANLTAIQAAIDAVAATGGTVFFPNSGKFRIAGQLNIANRSSIKLMAPGNSGYIGPDNANAALTLTATTAALLNLNGSEGIEICGLNLGYNNAGYIGNLIALQTDGVSLSANIHIHHCRIGGLQGAATGANSLINATGCLKLTVEQGFMDAALVGILGTSTGDSATNGVIINDIWFDRGFGCPIIAGGSSWTIEKCIFELNLAGTAIGIQTTSAGVETLNVIGCHFDDGSTTGTWINVNGGPIHGGVIMGNWIRNGARAINLGTSSSVAVLGNAIYALESIPPIVPGTATNCTALSNYVRTDSGSNVPSLLSATPGDGWLYDNFDSKGVRQSGRVKTVATLPAASGLQGARYTVTDANSTTFLSTVAGGGANIVPVFSDNTNWKIG